MVTVPAKRLAARDIKPAASPGMKAGTIVKHRRRDKPAGGAFGARQDPHAATVYDVFMPFVRGSVTMSSLTLGRVVQRGLPFERLP
ncbi:hypothetical protein Sa4125_13590 [Aureimonas sp. SA4125]|nr:hypothetical protein Sa4125_13590 [Aureimonas sp. SA4125]